MSEKNYEGHLRIRGGVVIIKMVILFQVSSLELSLCRHFKRTFLHKMLKVKFSNRCLMDIGGGNSTC